MRAGDQSSRRFGLWAVLSLILVGLNAAVGAQEIVKVPDGTMLVVQLKQSVRADRVRPGDRIHAKLLAPMLKNGKTLLPTGANILGVVVEAEPLAPSRPSRLFIRFEQAHWKHGAAELNAYLARYLVLKRTSGRESRELCPPPPNPPAFGEADDRRTPKDDLCYVPPGTRAEKEQVVFTSPVLTDIILRKLGSPSEATVLESDKKNISLPKGTIWEIRHNGSERSRF